VSVYGRVGLPPSYLQVSALWAGNVTFTHNVNLTCPLGTNFVDSFGGLYGPGSFPVNSPYCSSADPSVNQVLVSTLEFSCTACELYTYTVSRSYSTGGPNASVTTACLPCPHGGACENGTVTSTPGYWGPDVDAGAVELSICPSGYCCDGNANPCVAVNSCAGRREGPLCSDCSPGYVVAADSSGCVAKEACAKDRAPVWTLFLGGLLGLAIAQLTVVSPVWAKEARVPSARLKLLIYFAQVSGCWSSISLAPLSFGARWVTRSNL
jgi:hypothetical protein